MSVRVTMDGSSLKRIRRHQAHVQRTALSVCTGGFFRPGLCVHEYPGSPCGPAITELLGLKLPVASLPIGDRASLQASAEGSPHRWPQLMASLMSSSSSDARCSNVCVASTRRCPSSAIARLSTGLANNQRVFSRQSAGESYVTTSLPMENK